MKTRQSRVGPGISLRMSWTLTMMLLLTCTFLILILLHLGILSIPNVNHLNSIPRKTHMYYIEGEDDREERWVEIISWEPRAFLYHNFLSKEECEYLINIAKPNMKRSKVIDTETGEIIESRTRTSSGTFLKRGRDKIVSNIEKRIADLTFIPVENGENLQVLHYEVGQQFETHHDYFSDHGKTMRGSQRIATMLMYLSDVEEGGETLFPKAKGNFSSMPRWNKLSKCGKGGVSIKPKMGNALLFWSMKPDASIDPSSLHGGCPVIKGNKWSCTKWMRLHEHAT